MKLKRSPRYPSETTQIGAKVYRGSAILNCVKMARFPPGLKRDTSRYADSGRASTYRFIKYLSPCGNGSGGP